MKSTLRSLIEQIAAFVPWIPDWVFAIAAFIGIVAAGLALQSLINQVIKRIDTYDVHIKLDSDLDTIVKLWVVADRKLDLDKHEEHAAAPAAEGAEPEGKPAKGEAKAADGEPRKSKKAKSDDAGDEKPVKAKGAVKSAAKPAAKAKAPAKTPTKAPAKAKPSKAKKSPKVAAAE